MGLCRMALVNYCFQGWANPLYQIAALAIALLPFLAQLFFTTSPRLYLFIVSSLFISTSVPYSSFIHALGSLNTSHLVVCPCITPALLRELPTWSEIDVKKRHRVDFALKLLMHYSFCVNRFPYLLVCFVHLNKMDMF